AVLLRCEVGRHQQRQEAVLHQVQLLDDLRPEQAERVGERREREARVKLLGDRRTADERTALEDQDVQTRLREVAGVREAVVTSAYDDRVVAVGVGHRCSIRFEIGASSRGVELVLRGGLKSGRRSVVAGTERYSWSTVTSRCTVEPFAAYSGRT